jgi:hypothetical protein
MQQHPAEHERRKVRNREDAITSTRAACAPQHEAGQVVSARGLR